MSQFEAQPNEKTGRKPLPEVVRVSKEAHREFAELELVELLSFLSEKMGREVTLADLPSFAGGEKVMKHYQEVMAVDKDRVDLIFIQARLIEASKALREEVMRNQ